MNEIGTGCVVHTGPNLSTRDQAISDYPVQAQMAPTLSEVAARPIELGIQEEAQSVVRRNPRRQARPHSMHVKDANQRSGQQDLHAQKNSKAPSSTSDSSRSSNSKQQPTTRKSQRRTRSKVSEMVKIQRTDLPFASHCEPPPAVEQEKMQVDVIEEDLVIMASPSEINDATPQERNFAFHSDPTPAAAQEKMQEDMIEEDLVTVAFSSGTNDGTPQQRNIASHSEPTPVAGQEKMQENMVEEDPVTVESSSRTGDGPPQQRNITATKADTRDDDVLSPNTHVVTDPNRFYVEEEAHLYHNPPLPSSITKGVLPKDLRRIPPPPPEPCPPDTGMCKWSFDKGTRVYLADFPPQDQSAFVIHPSDEKFMLDIMERDDITLVSQGFLDKKVWDHELWSLDNIGASLDQDFYHRFRRFDTSALTDGTEKTDEIDALYSMKMTEYCRYLDQREGCLKSSQLEKDFFFTDDGGKEHKIDVLTSALYMIDLDLNKLLPSHGENFASSFRYPSVLPGGQHCMMNKVTQSARPFMGPNLYITPPASFTHFHQDGHGTVDSGHLALSGYNEVILLRRLTERHKRHALWLLTGDEEHADQPRPEFFDGLYAQPHEDGLGEKPKWPSFERIRKCEEMGYCPSVLVLKPGQLLHINKGRLHAFRKMSVAKLLKDDCHFHLRKDLIAERNMKSEELCISIAWDWMFRGSTARGINREVLATLEAAALCRKRARESLAIPELAILRMAQALAKPQTSFRSKRCIFVDPGKDLESVSLDRDTARIEICRGILPGLRYVVEEHVAAMALAGENRSQSDERGKRISLAEHPDTQTNPELSTVDPHGNSDFMCKLCSKELSNVYFHCDGCEKLLSKDFNICVSCHEAKHYAKFVQMHPQRNRRHATINHIGDMKMDRTSRCVCKNGPVCQDCSYCLGCSCRCHTWFTLNFRLFGKEIEQEILERVESVVRSWKTTGNGITDPYLDESTFTKQRLDASKKEWGHHDELIK